ncbi:MAG TPA: RusA family crossover junction endodeoxyribonuclease [Polyangia bacterium]|nr:RusA family crossover junction endodeoxyribonuclease [Polyangia bacterium]
MVFTILGPPRTKGNSPRIGISPRGKRFVLPSKASEVWSNSAILQVRSQVHRYRGNTFHEGQRWNCKALIYRQRNGPGDTDNYFKAIGDALQRGGAISNDRLIVSWDGSERLVDRKNPRVEIILTERE